jgi:Tetracyclin repressor-like, C-terminal domain
MAGRYTRRRFAPGARPRHRTRKFIHAQAQLARYAVRSRALGYFYLSNRFTMSAFLGTDLMAPAALTNWQEVMEDVLLSFVQRGTGRALRLVPGGVRTHDSVGS